MPADRIEDRLRRRGSELEKDSFELPSRKRF